MFGRWLKGTPATGQAPGAAELEAVVRRELSEADDETVLVVTAIAGLLGAIAYADRDYSEEEEQRVRRELTRVHGMTARGVDAICHALAAHVVEVATVQVPRYSRVLRELADRELRVEILDALVDLAAADGLITTAETNLLRTVTGALGLGQNDYNAAQERHRDRLAALQSGRSPVD